MDIMEKLRILSDAAKYDVSCSSSGSNRKNKKNGIGNAAVNGICHSFTEDGRCLSLLKILFTNKCIYNCHYCINRCENDTLRAEFTEEEIVNLTINFYKRNYIEGLFLSSGIVRSPDYTMEKLIRTIEILRNREKFNGYIHVKAIPNSDENLIRKLGLLADRISINIEMPTPKSLQLLAPQKTYTSIFRPMASINNGIIENKEDRKKFRKTPLFVPAGQSTQMIIGAGGEDDLTIINRAQSLYNSFSLKRVYYSNYIPVVKSQVTKDIKASPMLREHRVYQADFLMRYYGFKSDEILTKENPNFDLALDPKLNYAIEHIEIFPLEINKASYSELLKIPGFGVNYAKRIIKARAFAALKYDDLKSLKISTKRAKNFITVGGIYRGLNFSTKESLRNHMSTLDSDGIMQMSFFN